MFYICSSIKKTNCTVAHSFSNVPARVLENNVEICFKFCPTYSSH